MPSLILAAAAALAATAAQPERRQTPTDSPVLSYADLADLAVGAPVVAHVRVRDEDLLDAREAATVRPGFRRFLIEADVVALIRGAGGIPGAGQLPGRPAERLARAPRANRPEGGISAAGAPGRRIGPASFAWSRPTRRSPSRRRPPRGCARSCAIRARPTRRRGSPASGGPSTSPARCRARARPRSSCRPPTVARSR